MKFYSRLVPTFKSSSMSMQRLDSDFQIDDKNELDAETPTRSYKRNPAIKAREILSNATDSPRAVSCLFATGACTLISIILMGMIYWMLPWRVVFVGDTKIVTYSSPAYKSLDLNTKTDLNLKTKFRLDLTNWNTTLDDPADGAGKICIDAQKDLAKACPNCLNKCSTVDINLAIYTLVDRLLNYTFTNIKPFWAKNMTSNRLVEMSSYFMKNNTDMSTIMKVNFKYDTFRPPFVIVSQEMADQNAVGLDRLQEDMGILLKPACKWISLNLIELTDKNTQIEVDSEDTPQAHKHNHGSENPLKSMDSKGSGEQGHAHEHNHSHK